jgi:succinate-semialdehyde dehydrogenase/glutarate-semialdehyde dehydrogenase
MQSINPFSGAIIGSYPAMNQHRIVQQIEATSDAFLQWSSVSLSERSDKIRNLADELERNKESLARLITLEMGKPIRESRLEIAKCALLCRHYSEKAIEYLAEKHVMTEARLSKIRYEPLGVLFAIMPWNFPFWQVLRFAVPAITAGNAVLLKHAPNVTGCGFAIRDLMIKARLPQDLLGVLVMETDDTELVIAHHAVRGVSITGSEKAGRSVAALAGKHLKKVVLELGGSDPFVVFADAELGNACTTGMMSRMLNAGQVCIAAKRFIVHDEVYEEFIENQIQLLSALRPGDPLDETTTIGPIARPDLLEQVRKQVGSSVSLGARIRFGGKTYDQFPSIFMPSIIDDLKPGMPLWEEESFGPVMSIMRFTTVDQAITMANATKFGLGASIWTSDNKLAEYVASKMLCGSVFVNSLVKSDPRLPFGGIKNSGYGRELGEAGIKEFVNIKTHWFN